MFCGVCVNIGNMKSFHLGNKMLKDKKHRLDIDYVIEKDRKEVRKSQKAWRKMRKTQIFIKRHHDRTTPDDGRVMVMADGYGIGKNQEGWDLQNGNDGWNAVSDDGIGLGDVA